MKRSRQNITARKTSSAMMRLLNGRTPKVKTGRTSHSKSKDITLHNVGHSLKKPVPVIKRGKIKTINLHDLTDLQKHSIADINKVITRAEKEFDFGGVRAKMQQRAVKERGIKPQRQTMRKDINQSLYYPYNRKKPYFKGIVTPDNLETQGLKMNKKNDDFQAIKREKRTTKVGAYFDHINRSKNPFLNATGNYSLDDRMKLLTSTAIL